METILRKTKDAPVSIDKALKLLRSLKFGRVLNHSGNNVLADIEASKIPTLKQRLVGWIVSPQGANAEVPDTRVKVQSGSGY